MASVGRMIELFFINLTVLPSSVKSFWQWFAHCLYCRRKYINWTDFKASLKSPSRGEDVNWERPWKLVSRVGGAFFLPKESAIVVAWFKKETKT
jgi:hypothetical protein